MVLVPVPVIPPGFIVQVPTDGKPFNTTLPVETVHVGCVMVPTIGADGVVTTTVLETVIAFEQPGKIIVY